MGRREKPARSCSSHARKKDNPGKEAYKLAHGRARKLIGAVEVNDKARIREESERRVWCQALERYEKDGTFEVSACPAEIKVQ